MGYLALKSNTSALGPKQQSKIPAFQKTLTALRKTLTASIDSNSSSILQQLLNSSYFGPEQLSETTSTPTQPSESTSTMSSSQASSSRVPGSPFDIKVKDTAKRVDINTKDAAKRAKRKATQIKAAKALYKKECHRILQEHIRILQSIEDSEDDSSN